MVMVPSTSCPVAESGPTHEISKPSTEQIEQKGQQHTHDHGQGSNVARAINIPYQYVSAEGAETLHARSTP